MRRKRFIAAMVAALGLMFSGLVTTVPAGAAIGETMYDASVTNVSAIPSNAQIVAGADAWTQADFNRFPNAQHVKISCDGTNYAALVIDFESKCVFTQSALVNWIKQHQALGIGPGTVYAWHGNIATVQSYLAGYTYNFWVADQTGVEHTYPGPSNEIATQWCGYGGTHKCPGNDLVDESLVTDPAALTGLNVPVLRGTTSVNSGTGTSRSTITVPLPSGFQPGDLLAIWLTWNGTGTTPTLSGWTRYTKSTSTIGLQLFTRVADGTEGSSVSITFASGYVYSALCVDYANVSSTTPLDPVPSNSGQVNSASTTIAVRGVTTTLANDELVWFGVTTGPSGATPGTITVPSGFTAQTTQNDSDSAHRNQGTIFADQMRATAGATGAKNGTSSTSEINGGLLLALAGS